MTASSFPGAYSPEKYAQRQTIPVNFIQLLRMLEGRDAGVVGAKVLKSMTIMKKPGSPDGNIKAIIKARDRGNSEASKQEQ